MGRLGKFFVRTIGALALVAVVLFAWHAISPWPAALFFRGVFYVFTAQITSAIGKHEPVGITSLLDRQYDETDADARLDIYFPESAKEGRLLTIVWIHGGGFISGSRKDVASYAKILAAKGYTVVTVGYSIAPERRYPRPVQQANAALAYLAKNAAGYPIDASRIVLAGDSAGAQIAAQTALIVSDPAHAKAAGVTPGIARQNLIGVILHCGVLDARLLGRGGGVIGLFLRTVGRSYFGTEDFSAPIVKQFSVAEHANASLPPVFISAGNKDPLLPHSLSMAAALERAGVRVDKLFFPADYSPALDHEYQFNLDTDAGKLALARTVEFLQSLK